jgi:hypothetical protein
MTDRPPAARSGGIPAYPSALEWHQRGRHIDAARDPLLNGATRITTIGGCSALDLAEGLQAVGYNARVHPTGYFHTPATVRQELERALGCSRTRSLERSWRLSRGVVDPDKDYRGRTFADEAELIDWSARFDAAADELLRQSEVVVVVVGNAEAWIDRRSRHHLSELPPAEVFLGTHHILHRLTVAEIVGELSAIRRLVVGELGARLVVAVSAVPLSEVFCETDPRLGTFVVKSRLRAAVSEFTDEHPDARYFPLYEAVFGAERPSEFMAEDGRHTSIEAREYITWRFLVQFGTDGGLTAAPPDETWPTGPTKTARDYVRRSVRREPESWLAWPRRRSVATVTDR